MLRILKIGRYSRSLRMFGRVFRSRRDDLVLIALPAGILAGAFADEIRRQKTEAATVCPHCGKAIAG
jgi:hypothetical protein